MAIIFTRPPAYSAWDPTELAGPYEPLTLREWEVAVATCGLAAPLQRLLRETLLEPATSTCERRQRWPLPRHALPFEEQLLRQGTVETLRQHLLDKLASLWQVLDLPPGVIPGMLRGLLLVGLGAYLRQVLDALQGQAEALPPHQELEQALSGLGVQIEPAPAQPVSLPQPRRRQRWWRRRGA
jgi:hypothetical protein